MRGKKCKETECSVPDCTVKPYARGWCQRHYYRWRNNGHLGIHHSISSYDRFDNNGDKLCSKCKEFLPIDSFSSLKQTRCRQCLNADKYGVTKAQIQQVLLAQNNLCALCGERQACQIDHDRSCCPGRLGCGKCVRGILCRECNTGLGLIGETVESLQAAMNYLSRRAL